MDDIFISYRKYQCISARLDHVFGKRLKKIEALILNNYLLEEIEPQVNQTIKVDNETYKIKDIIAVYDEEVTSHYIVVQLIT